MKNDKSKTLDFKQIDKYIPAAIEKKWQEDWAKYGLYRFTADSKKEKYYNLVELPYPSGDLHLGHWFTFTTADTHARYQKMSGKNVFFPNGFDAFGLPAENAAIKRGIHPRDWTLSNIETMKKQFATMGTMIDWSHEAITCLPEYYSWNQWIFLKMFEKGLAYRGKAMSNWCPSCQTVLANEGIEDGKCWRCGSIVEQKPIEQWFLKITEYADQLLWDNTEESKKANGVLWPKSVREGQNNWIGRSEGVEITFPLAQEKKSITVYTVFPETIYGVTYMVLAPEHPLAVSLATKEYESQVMAYIREASEKTELERKTLEKDKSGVFTGSYCINPVTSEQVPIWIGDYVIASYGTGAVMGVPGSDHRDFAFAQKYALKIKRVIAKDEVDTGDITSEEDVLEEGVLVASGEFSGIKTPNPARELLKEFLIEKGFATRKTQYHLHDWSVSRQRYWGTPVPMIHCDRCGIVPVAEKDLPVELPYEVDYTPKGKPPLATAEEWVNVTCPKCSGKAKRDAETMDTFFDSSWYFFRYINPKYDQAPFDTKLAQVLMPVDIYYGGAEHTLGHTLYARFFTKFFHDLGLIDFEEFAHKRVQHGIILGPDGFRMSKSRGNVVNPDDVVKEYGSDTVRLYLCFMMPYEATAPWSLGAISGVHRFLKRIWELRGKVVEVDQEISKEDRSQMAKTIRSVGEDIGLIKFNTAVAHMMEFLNYLSRKETVSMKEYKTLLLLLAPFAPHMSEEIWQLIRGGGAREFKSIHKEMWPIYEESDLVEEVINIVVQVNGKMRDSIQIASDEGTSKEKVEEQARKRERVKKYIEGKVVEKVVFVPSRAINFVIPS